MRFPKSILLGMVFLWGKAFSQGLTIVPDLRFENFNTERNFISDYVGNMTVDSKGYLWATSNGLIRFDGVHLQHYTNFNNQYHGLRSNYSDDLITDYLGRLWIGNGLGLCYFNDTLGKFHYIDKDTITPISYAYAFYLSGEEMWFVCNLGLCRINLQTLAVTETSLKEFADPIETFPLGDHLLGIGTRTGVYLYDIKKNTWTKQVFTYQGNSIRVRQCIYNKGIYWLGTNKGLWQLDETGEHIYPVSGTGGLNISNLSFHPLDKEKRFIWMSTTNNGLRLFNTETNKVEQSFFHDDANPHSLPTNNITSLHFDSADRLWLGTEKGVSMFDYRNQYWKTREVTFREGITADNEIRKTVQDLRERDKVWMSCINQGLLLVDWKSKQVLKHYKDFPAESALSFQDMHQLPGGNLILLARNKLFEWDPVSGKINTTISFPAIPSLPVNRELTSIMGTGGEDLYITTNTGLYKYQPSSGSISPVIRREGKDLYSSYDLQQGVCDKNGILWLASRKGLVRYDSHTQEARIFYYYCADSVTVNYLGQVALAGDDRVVCASSSGINIFDIRSESFSRVNEFGNVRNPGCNSVAVKGSIAWVNSNAGLLQIDLNSRKGRVMEISQENLAFSPVRFGEVNDELVMGYRNMYVYFDPAKITGTDLPANPVIERILLNNTPLYSIPGNDREYTFTYKQNTFSFYFTAFEFNNPGQIQFRYRLEGHDREWTYLDEQRNATYIRLPPGHYTFRVQAGNTQGQWNEDSAVFHMHIVPPFWQRWWFWPLLAIVFVTVVLLVARKRVNSIQKREQEKTALNKSMAELETQLLRSQMNPHFIFNSLNSIQKYIWENKEEDAAEYLARFAKLIRAILENSRLETIPLAQELEVLKLYIELEHRRSNGKFDYRIHSEKNLELDRILVPPLLLQPYIENAIWHGLNKKQVHGQLDISIRIENNRLIYIIDDDGTGRSRKEEATAAGKKSLGMEITRQRISKLQENDSEAGVQIIDKTSNGEPSGTTVIVSIPVKYKIHA
ncbi:MAG: histidine kinase [Chitinophagaceae bacterium]